MKKIDLTNQRFGRLVVIKESDKRTKRNRPMWVCECDCGNRKIVESRNLRRGSTRSCGCYTKEIGFKRNLKHGDSRKRLYRIWHGIKNRVSNPNQTGYENYGGRGIKMCQEWFNSYEVFKEWALEAGYDNNLSIDRIDNDGHYEPSNCRWVDMKIQAQNKSSNNLITYNGKTMNVSQWSKELGIPRETISTRIHKYNMTPEEALKK